MRFLLGTLLIAAGPLSAETDFTALSDAERAAFQQELRALFLDEPELLTHVFDTPSPYEDEAAQDHAVLDFETDRLFGPGLAGFGPADAPVRMAILIDRGCEACPLAMDELEALAAGFPLRVNVVTIDDAPGLMDALELDVLPSYVFDGLIVRGHVPPVVLERYIRQRME